MDYRGFFLSSKDGWTIISAGGRVFGKVPELEEAKTWVDLYLQQHP